MNCPKCNFIIKTDEKRCLNCGANINYLKKCVNISNHLYNKGLNLSNKREFSNAIEYIEKSILYNKSNIQARNLLGLLYYKIGHFADAMKQWIISTNYNSLDDNTAFYYIDIIKNNMRYFEKGNDAVRLYNQAIRYLNRKNDDLAVIRLKNSLKIYPDLIDSMNLLTFCYIIQSKNKKALENVKNTLNIDHNNKTALFYLTQISLSMENNILDQKYVHNGNIDVISENKNKENHNFKYKVFTTNAFIFIIGFVLSALFMYFLYIPDYKEKFASNSTESIKKYEESKSNYEILMQEISSENEQLKLENEQLQKQIENYNTANTLRLNRNKLEQVNNLIQSNKKEEAKSIFDTIDTSSFSEEDIKNYEDIKTNF